MHFAGKIRPRLGIDIGRHIVRVIIRQAPTPATRHVRLDEGGGHRHLCYARGNGIGLRSPHRWRGYRPLAIETVTETTFAREYFLPVVGIERAS